MREPLLHLRFNGIVVCLTSVVTVGGDIEESWKWFQELSGTYGLATNGTRGGKLTIKRV